MISFHPSADKGLVNGLNKGDYEVINGTSSTPALTKDPASHSGKGGTVTGFNNIIDKLPPNVKVALHILIYYKGTNAEYLVHKYVFGHSRGCQTF